MSLAQCYTLHTLLGLGLGAQPSHPASLISRQFVLVHHKHHLGCTAASIAIPKPSLSAELSDLLIAKTPSSSCKQCWAINKIFLSL